MKKVVLIIALLFLSVNSFAGNNLNEVIIENKSIELNVAPQENDYLHLIICITSCGYMAHTYSYSAPSQSDIDAWNALMDEYYCTVF